MFESLITSERTSPSVAENGGSPHNLKGTKQSTT